MQLNVMNSFTFFGFNHEISTWLVVLVTMAGILFISVGFVFLTNRFFLEIIKKFVARKYPIFGNNFFSYRVLNRISHIFAGLIVYSFADLLTIAPIIYSVNLVNIVKSLAIAYMIISLSFAISASLNFFEHHYKELRIGNRRSIKGYVQGIKIILFVVTTILVISELLNKSPAYLLTSIGAITAVILVAFKEQFMGFAANIQIAAADLVRLGDWIEVPQYGVDGNVIEISLSRIKVQNFDNTTASIPAYTLLSNGVKNWRGIKEAGGRRIKRAFHIDINTVRFCDDALLENLEKSTLMTADLYAQFIKKSLERTNTNTPLTNLGLFRFYLQNHINTHPRINQEMARIVRHLDPTSIGIPIEICMFTKETNWEYYEAVQADIFDHIFAILPSFKLAVFQHLSGSSLSFNTLAFQPSEMREPKIMA